MLRSLKLACCFLLVAIIIQTALAKNKTEPGLPDQALMQKIWDGWSTLKPANAAPFYATGPNTFFDALPLKYSSWEEYQQGSAQLLTEYKAAAFTLNDDAKVYAAGDYAWGTATLKFDLTHQSGKRDMGAMRWTVVWQKQNGKWLIVHEHVSVPMQ